MSRRTRRGRRYHPRVGRETFKGVSYDIIGDIHGHCGKLDALLDLLGYRQPAGVWQHPKRQGVFVGDFIDRGPEQVRGVVTCVARGIAFVRVAPTLAVGATFSVPADVFVMPALGGAERRVEAVTVFDSRGFHELAWRPDGKWLAISGRQSPADTAGS